jgi:hypothetical protein
MFFCAKPLTLLFTALILIVEHGQYGIPEINEDISSFLPIIQPRSLFSPKSEIKFVGYAPAFLPRRRDREVPYGMKGGEHDGHEEEGSREKVHQQEVEKEIT